jgi:hypothetical protein
MGSAQLPIFEDHNGQYAVPAADLGADLLVVLYAVAEEEPGGKDQGVGGEFTKISGSGSKPWPGQGCPFFEEFIMHTLKFAVIYLAVVGAIAHFLPPILLDMGMPLWLVIIVGIAALAVVYCATGGMEDQARLKDQLAEAEMKAKLEGMNRPKESPPENRHGDPDSSARSRESDSNWEKRTQNLMDMQLEQEQSVRVRHDR